MLPPKRKTTDYIYTFNGMTIFPEEMTSEQVLLNDISYALAGIYRYNGHSRISVLRHSLAVYHLLTNDSKSLRVRLLGLLHDAPEAYIMDIPVPKKKYMRKSWQAAHDHIESCIFERFNFTPTPTEKERRLVHRVDKEVIEYEMDNPDPWGGATGMGYPGKRQIGPIRIKWIMEAYNWPMSEEDLMDEFESLILKLTLELQGLEVGEATSRIN